MISPIHIITIALGISFSLGILGKLGKNFSAAFVMLGLGFMTFISFQWSFAHLFGTPPSSEIFTAGFKPPYSINLQMGLLESVLTLLVNIVGLLGSVYLLRKFKEEGINSMIIYIILIMGLDAMIMTRDLFNLFVFIEVESIAVAGLIIITKSLKSISAGFKYVLASGIISALFLLGVVFVYAHTGTLNLDGAIASNLLAVKGGFVVVFLVIIALILELKPFPANGWALDVYETANSGIGAIISSASATASLFVLYKVMPLAGETWYSVVAVIGVATFIGSNLLGIKQEITKRLLGYSSIGQIGLLMAIIGLSPLLGDKFLFIAFGILISHYLAKAGLFWLAGILQKENIKDWSVLRKHPFLLFLFGTFVFALSGLPPFPSFFAKWELVMELASSGQYIWIGAILVGSLLEVVYLFRWFGYASKLENTKQSDYKIDFEKMIPIAIFAIAAYVIGVLSYLHVEPVQNFDFITYLPILLVVFLFFTDFLPIVAKNIISIVIMAYYGYEVLPELYETDLLRFIFMVIFVIGGILTLIPGFAYKGKRRGFYPQAMLMYAGLIGIVMSQTTLQFFLYWEFLTIGSYLLILRGKKAMPHAYSYILFSVGGAFAILVGFAIARVGNSIDSLEILSNIHDYSLVAFSLLAIGFMTKIASLGLHIWLPGAHAESESDVSPMVSAILLKGGVFGLLILFLAMGAEKANGNSLLYILGWIGALTALIGNLSASFQEDAKKLLAYSSIGQLGYVLFAFAMVSNLGWLGGFTLTINHFLFKSILFLVIGGIVLRIKTHNMYEMGGLIKNMPFSFIAVLIGIITLAGVPPLSGYGAKWFLYNGIIEQGWYFQGAILLFSGIIAFLYCFRLIYSIFLGQRKDEHIHVKEISVWFLIPVYILIGVIMVYSMRPSLVLKPIGKYLSVNFPSNGLTWEGTTAISNLGYWDGNWVMIIVGVMFALLFTWLWVLNAKAQKVKQFNIVYAAERPLRPETTHQAHNLYAGYNKALGFLVTPNIVKFWNGLSETVSDIAGLIRKVYTGDGQTYILHIIIYIVLIFLFVVY